MEKLFIETRKKFKDNEVNYSLLNKIKGETISLAATIQYLDLVPKVKSYLESKGKKVLIKKGAYYDAHVLGCNPNAFSTNAEVLLLITDGKFHALNNAVRLKREIIVFTTQTLEKISKEEIQEYLEKIKIKQNKFLMADSVGLLVTTKQGQHTKNFQAIRERIEKSGKRVYLFETNNIDTSDFENFPKLKLFVNTACYGLGFDDDKIINLQDILEFI